MNLSGSKWDTQVGDISVLAPFALILPRSEWRQLAVLAESLTAQLTLIENQLLQRADLWPQLGLPRNVLDALNCDEPWTPSAGRIVRYDFHPTAEGWKISEVNSDVPSGLTESSFFTRLMADKFSGLKPAGDPLATLTNSLASFAGETRRIALLSAPGYTEDLQINAGLAATLAEFGIETSLARPEQLVWENGYAFIRQNGRLQPISGIYRFYQGEWLARIPVEKWRPLLRSGHTPVCNPAVAILSESKRLPLLWNGLRPTPVSGWQKILPETVQPREILRTGLTDWVLKPAYCNMGETIIGAGWQTRMEMWLGTVKAVSNSRTWIAQRRFQTLTINTPLGPMHPCIGVYTINGIATGIYGRLSPKPVIDYSARDVAILLCD